MPLLKKELENIFQGRSIGEISRSISCTKNGKYDILISLIKEKTKFLDEDNIDISLSERIYCIFNDIKERPKCNTCKNNVNYRSQGYRNYCSSKCAQNNINIQNKRKQTCLEKYGVESYTKTKEYNEKSKKTCLEKYGVESIMHLEKYKDKQRQTCLEKYGVESYTKTKEYKEKSTATCLEKYGVEYYLQSKKCKEKSKETCLEKYGVEYGQQSEIFKEKSKKTCLEKYGVEYSLQSNIVRDKSKKTCLEKYGVEYAQQSKEVREKSITTCLEKYGVEYYLQVPEFYDKQKLVSGEYNIYILPSGKEVKIQGYENKFLDEYFLNGGLESNILIKTKEINDYLGIIYYYTSDFKKHRYYPDCYLINENKIIEVKSTWTYKCDKDKNNLKKQACLDKGLNFEFKIYE